MPSEAIVGRSTAWGTPPKPDLEIEVTPLPPIFLVGEEVDRQRLAKLLDGRGGISCAPESDLLSDLAGVARRNWPDLCHYGYPEQYWFRRVAGFFDSLQTEYAASRHLSRWAATADPDALALIDRLFPKCRVVRVVAAGRPARSRADGASIDLTKRLSDRYYQLSLAELTQRPDAAVAGVLSFLDPLVEVPSRP